MKVLIIIAILVGAVMYFGKADATCKEAQRLKETPTTHQRWVQWEEKYQC